MRCKIIIFISVIVFFLTILSSNIAYSAGNYNINATVKISVCGNGIVEDGEDCDGMNLNAKTCQNLKFLEGTLSCDISCSFNTSQCIVATPKLANIQIQIQTWMPTQTPPSVAPAITLTTTLNNARTTSFQPILPPALDVFDINKNGHITKSELPDILKMWILSWKSYSEHKECELIGDGACDIRDLSVLLYYVDR